MFASFRRSEPGNESPCRWVRKEKTRAEVRGCLGRNLPSPAVKSGQWGQTARDFYRKQDPGGSALLPFAEVTSVIGGGARVPWSSPVPEFLTLDPGTRRYLLGHHAEPLLFQPRFRFQAVGFRADET